MSAVSLVHRAVGAPELPPLVIAHGLFGSGRNWGAVAKRLSARRHVISVDMRNHAQSPWSEDHSYGAMAADLAQVIDGLGGPVEVLGHSMGGKAAMVLAAHHPHLVRHLIVVDIAPVAYAHTQLPLIDAMEALDLSHVTRRSDADSALAERIEDAQVRAFLLQSLEVADGLARWRLNLSALRTNMPSILSFPADCPMIGGKVSVLYGARSYYLDSAGRAAFARLCPSAAYHEVSAAGHWVHAENPVGFDQVLQSVLD
ncbi:MAG: alpha/beta fold hydrolase [Pseudomonadota bacterium]